MKKLNTLMILTVTLAVISCTKSADTGLQASGAINVTNAVVGGTTLTLQTTNNLISSSNTVGNNAAAWFPLVSGNLTANLGVPAVAATATSPVVPAIPYYSQPLTVDNNSNYSLFLTGASPSAVESVLIKETYPRAYADSVCAVRFINLSPGSNPISVNIKGNANGSEVSSLAYKAYNGFNQHPAKAVNVSYIFEFRDAGTGTLITSYTLKTPYIHNVTLALRGPASGARGVILDPDYQ